jgi:PAS domain S-box-containing protein
MPVGNGPHAGRDNAWMLWICLLYLAVASLWIIGSDALLELITSDPARLSRYQTYKGWLFVAATAALLYYVMVRAAATATARPQALSTDASGDGDSPMRPSGLSRSIMAGGAVLVMAILALVGHGLHSAYSETLRQSSDNADNLAHVIETQTQHAVESTDLGLRMLAAAASLSQSRGLSQNEAVREQMLQAAVALSHVRAFFILDELGRMTVDTDSYPAPLLDFSDREYFTAHRDNPDRELFISASIVSRTSGKPFLALSRRIERPQGGFGGVIVAAIDTQYFENVYSSLNIGREGSVSLFLRDGRFLVRFPQSSRDMGKSFSDRPEFARLLEMSERGIYRAASRVDGVDRIFSYRAVLGFPLVVIVGLSEREALAVWYRYAEIESLAVLLFVVTVIVLAYILVAQIRHREVLTAALSTGEQRYRYLFEANPRPMWLRDIETQRIIAVNDAATRLYGYTREEFLALPVDALWPPEDKARRQAFLEQRGPDADSTSIWRHLRKDGTTMEVEVVSRLFVVNGRRTRLSLLSDVTDKLRVEKALRESEQRLRTITDNVPVLIGYVDSEQRYRFVNRAFEAWHGISRDGHHGKTVREVTGEARYAMVRPQIDAVLAGQTVTVERMIKSAAKEAYWRTTYVPHFGERGNVEGFYILGYDITDRRKAEEALAHERTLLRLVIDNLPDHVYVKDLERRYILVNSSSLKARGCADYGEVIGKTGFDFYPREIAEQYDAEDREVIQTGAAFLNREQCVTHADGSRTWHLTAKVPMRGADGSIIGIVGINRDITEIKRGQELIRELNASLEQKVLERTAQLEAANRELESFAYSVSHDLRAPLRSIDGFSHALLEDYRDRLDEAGRDYLQRVRKSSQRMAALIDDLLELSRITRTEMHMGMVDMSAIAHEVVAEIEREWPNRAVEVNIVRGVRARADEGLMRVALDNLLRNAWKFTAGRVPARIEFGVEQRAEGKVYFVRDNGVGFDMAHASKLFGAFQRLHSNAQFPGTGIGLATVQRVMHRHGGRIWAESAPDKGSTFFFTF